MRYQRSDHQVEARVEARVGCNGGNNSRLAIENAEDHAHYKGEQRVTKFARRRPLEMRDWGVGQGEQERRDDDSEEWLEGSPEKHFLPDTGEQAEERKAEQG